MAELHADLGKTGSEFLGFRIFDCLLLSESGQALMHLFFDVLQYVGSEEFFANTGENPLLSVVDWKAERVIAERSLTVHPIRAAVGAIGFH
jgi:hypothetical protein